MSLTTKKCKSSLYLMMGKTFTGLPVRDLYTDNIWFNRIVYIIGTALTGSILIFHSIKLLSTYINNNRTGQLSTIVSKSPSPGRPSSVSISSITSATSKSKHQKYQKLNHILTFSMIIAELSRVIFHLIGFFGFWYQWFGFLPDCGLYIPITTALWHTYKCLMYFIIVLRMKLVFTGSMYQYSNKIIYSLYTFILLFWCYAMFGDFTEIYGTYQYIPDENTYWCQYYMAVFGVILSGGIDFMISVVCLILFTKPLFTMLRNIRGIGAECEDSEFEGLIVKYFLLTFIAVGSTLLYLFIAFKFELGVLAAIDSDINILCVLLMNKSYERYYYLCCGVCHRLIGKCKSESNGNNAQHNIDIEL